jgi:pimeloyl-ACP methyl ester carboxylesterase
MSDRDAPLPIGRRRTTRLRHLVRLLILVLLVVQVGIPLLLYLGRNALIFFPGSMAPPEAGLTLFRGAVQGELIHIVRPDGRRLAAYDVHPARLDDASDAASAPVVLFFHGNAGDIAMRAPMFADVVRRTGLRWVAPDYSGYGGNQGKPSEAEVELDALAAFDHLVAEGVAPGRIVLFGQSLGGAVAVYLATQRPAAGLTVQSSFASVGSMARRLYPWLPLTGVLARNVFPSADRLRNLRLPIVIAHGRRDRVIPFVEGEALRDAAPEGTAFIALDNAGHDDMFDTGGDVYLRELTTRFRSWVK